MLAYFNSQQIFHTVFNPCVDVEFFSYPVSVKIDALCEHQDRLHVRISFRNFCNCVQIHLCKSNFVFRYQWTDLTCICKKKYSLQTLRNNIFVWINISNAALTESITIAQEVQNYYKFATPRHIVKQFPVYRNISFMFVIVFAYLLRGIPMTVFYLQECVLLFFRN